MPQVIQCSIVIMLEIVPTEHAPLGRSTIPTTNEWLLWLNQQFTTMPHLRGYQIHVRQISLEHSTKIQILLSWIVLQTQHHEQD